MHRVSTTCVVMCWFADIELLRSDFPKEFALPWNHFPKDIDFAFIWYSDARLVLAVLWVAIFRHMVFQMDLTFHVMNLLRQFHASDFKNIALLSVDLLMFQSFCDLMFQMNLPSLAVLVQRNSFLLFFIWYSDGRFDLAVLWVAVFRHRIFQRN